MRVEPTPGWERLSLTCVSLPEKGEGQTLVVGAAFTDRTDLQEASKSDLGSSRGLESLFRGGFRPWSGTMVAAATPPSPSLAAKPLGVEWSGVEHLRL